MQKIRGSLVVNKNLRLPNPSDSSPAQGLIAVSDEQGNVFWGHVAVLSLSPDVYPKAGTLVRYLNEVYFSLADAVSGQQIEDETKWAKLGGTSGTLLLQSQIDALDEANEPGANNPYATMGDIQNLSLQGTDTASNIFLKSAAIKNNLWISSTEGVDWLGDTVAPGHGVVSTGTYWKTIGPFVGPKGEQGVQGVAGNNGQPGPEGPLASTYTYPQTVAAETWVIPHNLGKYPSVTIVNTGRSTIESTVNYVDENNIVVTVYPMSAGFAYLN